MRLDKPTNLTFIESSENSITVSWDAVENANGYLVQCRDVVQNGWDNCTTTITEGNVTTATIAELYPTATFEICVIALSQQECYEDSEESETIYADTLVGSCAPKDKKKFCCIL